LDAEQKTQWEHQNLQTKLIAIEMIKAGNQFWFTHRVDTRGRMYARGYQLNPQGNSWRKAMLILADPDYVEITR
jgi:DNA-directed RNA polymerase